MKYFAYGLNVDPDRMRKRKINFSKREHAILEGRRLKFNKVASENPNMGYANIEKSNENVVEGILYTINDTDIDYLDTYEGYPKHYIRENVKVKLDNIKEESIIYIANTNKVRDGLKPSKDYLNHLLKGCDLLSDKYCKELKNWKQ